MPANACAAPGVVRPGFAATRHPTHERRRLAGTSRDAGTKPSCDGCDVATDALHRAGLLARNLRPDRLPAPATIRQSSGLMGQRGNNGSLQRRVRVGFSPTSLRRQPASDRSRRARGRLRRCETIRTALTFSSIARRASDSSPSGVRIRVHSASPATAWRDARKKGALRFGCKSLFLVPTHGKTLVSDCEKRSYKRLGRARPRGDSTLGNTQTRPRAKTRRRASKRNGRGVPKSENRNRDAG